MLLSYLILLKRGTYVVPHLCPTSYAHSALSASHSYFLAANFLNFGCPVSNYSTAGSGPSLAAKLAKLQTALAPILEGFRYP